MGIEIDLVFVLGSKLTLFLCAGRNYMVLMYRSKLTWFLCGWSKLTCFFIDLFFCLRAANGLVFVWVFVIYLISAWAIDPL